MQSERSPCGVDLNVDRKHNGSLEKTSRMARATKKKLAWENPAAGDRSAALTCGMRASVMATGVAAGEGGQGPRAEGGNGRPRTLWYLSCGCSPICGTRFEVLENVGPQLWLLSHLWDTF